MIIYKTTNLLNKKIYVGKDCCGRSNYFGSGVWITRAIKKYGKENFKKETLEVCDGDNVDAREIYWIKKLQARNPKIGYNLAIGGDGIKKGYTHTKIARENISKGNSQRGKRCTYEHAKKISEALKGRALSEETKIKMSLANKGKHHSRTTILKMSLARMGHPTSEETKRKIGLANSIALLGKKHSDSWKRKMSIRNKGKNNPMYGKRFKHTEEAKRKISLHHKSRKDCWQLRKAA